MNSFKNTLNKFYNDFGTYKAMVLSTSLNDKVSSRMVSVIVIDGIFYFQTNKKLKKYNQIKENKNIALSADNISIEGVCYELGLPINNKKFCDLYKEPFLVHIVCIPNQRMRYCFRLNQPVYKNGFMEMVTHL